MGLAVDEADEADDVERALCVDCITLLLLLLLLLGTDVCTAELAPSDEEFGECGPDEIGLFFHGWNPLPTAASARGGGDLLDSLLHWAASMASGVPRRPGWSVGFCMCVMLVMFMPMAGIWAP